jgi:branched-chain amino acid transport system substrate-binding protein
LLASAIEATQSTDPKKIIDHLAKGSYVDVASTRAMPSTTCASSAVTVFTFKGKEVTALTSL